LYRVGAINKVEEEMGKYNTDICAVQEIRWPWKETVIKRIVYNTDICAVQEIRWPWKETVIKRIV
jgi:mRNA deadenylase 3'-5' endonuclease subunit Ccr4